MAFLFVGLIAGGIGARLTLLAHRGGFFFQDEAAKSSSMVFFDLLGTILGLSSFIVSFFLFEWWLPVVAFVLGYWVVPVITVSRSSFAFLYSIRLLFAMMSTGCAAGIWYLFLA
jgi:hypothetical protein